MAISASKSKNIYCANSSSYAYTIYVKFTESSTSVANNTSTISISGYMIGNNIGWSSNYNSYLKLYWHDNNTNTDKLVATSSAFKSLSMNSKKNVSGSITVSHKSDGSLSGYAKISYVAGSTSGGWAPSSNSVSTSTTALTKIARASSISSLSGTYIGSSVSVSISRQISTATHKVEYSFAGSGYTVVDTDATNSCTFTPPLSLCSYIPNSTSGTLTIRITTYYGGSQIGSSVTKSITLYVPSSVVPSIGGVSLSRVDNGVPSSWGVYVKGFSKCTAAITSASGSYGSTITSYYISGGGLSTSSSSGTTPVLNSAGTYTFTFTVTDSRGRTASRTSSITVIDYYSPSISVSAKRCISDGTENGSGTYLKVTANYSIASVSGKNSVASRSVSCNGASNTSFSSGVAFVLAANCSQGSSYVLTASVTDALGRSASVTYDISTAERIMNVSANKKGLAIGKFSERTGFEVGWPAYFHDKEGSNVLIREEWWNNNSGQNLNNDYNSVHFAYSSHGSPSNGTVATFSGLTNGYQWQLASNYQNSSYIYTRTKNGDNGSWNPWSQIVTSTTDAIVTFDNTNGYPGFALSNYIRAPKSGFLPYSASSSGVGYLGTPGWPFGCLYVASTTAIAGFSFSNGWLGFYGSYSNASNRSGRKAWMGHDGGTTLTISNEASSTTRILGSGSTALKIGRANTSRYINVTFSNGTDSSIVSFGTNNLDTYLGPQDLSLSTKTILRGLTVRLYAHSGGGVYLGYSGSTAVTSDRNLKTDIVDLNEKFENFFYKLRPITYKYNAEEVKGHRDHVGFIAQEVEDALTESGLTTEEFAGIIIEKDVSLNPDYDASASEEENKKKEKVYEKLYSLRYEEFIALNTHMIQKCLKEIKALKEEIEQLKGAQVQNG